MKKEQEQAFFKEIEEVLHSHDETYELGAWEEFDANRKGNKRKWPIYAWATAAAVLLLVGFGLFEIANKDKLYNNHTLVKNLNKQGKVKEKTEITQQLPLKDEAGNSVIVNAASNLVNSILPQVDQVIALAKPNQQPENVAIATATKDTIIATLVVKSVNKPVIKYDSLVNRNLAVVKDEITTSKLTYSLVVSPSLSDKKVNFGGGMELSYQLGDRLSISSGLMYTSLSAKSDGKSLVATGNKPQGANLAVSGIELPLGLKYQTNSGFYAAASVSALGLLNNQLEYSFLEEKTVIQTAFSAGVATEVFKVVSEKKTENSIVPLNNYMGFFNFSAGKKQAFGKVNLNIGPFVKVPFNSVSTEQIKLLQGGIKISVDF